MISIPMIQACSRDKYETKQYLAKPGDILVMIEGTRIELTHQFKPGAPNGLLDGGVKIKTKGSETLLAEVNAICSLPDLPNWPNYDNIYGRWLNENEIPGSKGGETDWQLLIYFDGKEMNSGIELAPKWANRLAMNLCRKGDFADN